MLRILALFTEIFQIPLQIVTQFAENYLTFAPFGIRYWGEGDYKLNPCRRLVLHIAIA